MSEDGKQEVKVQHKWLWAISPIMNTTNLNSTVAFVAHCRGCNQTYTQSLWVPTNGGQLGKVDLPEWGCTNPMGGLI